MGREIEFHYKNKNTSLVGTTQMIGIYIVNKQKALKPFSSEDLLNKATLDNTNINNVFDEVVVDYIL